MKHTGWWVAVIWCIAGAACTDANSASDGGAVRDSAGIRIFDLVQTLDTTRILSSSGTLAGSEDRPIGVLRDLRFLSDSSVAMADGFANSVLIVNSKDDSFKTVGRRGSGPGEFGGILFIQPADDGFWTFDPVQFRLILFDFGGTVVRQRSDLPKLAPEGEYSTLFPVGLLQGRLVAMAVPAIREVGEDGKAWGRAGLMLETASGEYEPIYSFRLNRCRPEPVDRCRADPDHHSGLVLVGESSVLVFPADKPEGYWISQDGTLRAVIKYEDSGQSFTNRSFVDRTDRAWLQSENGEWQMVRFREGDAWVVDLPKEARPWDAIGNKVALIRTDDLDVATLEVVVLLDK